MPYIYQAPEMQEVQKSLRIVLSESNYQLQDLDTIKDDLGTLRLGFAVIQHSNSELSTDSHRHRYKLKEITYTLDHHSSYSDYKLTLCCCPLQCK